MAIQDLRCKQFTSMQDLENNNCIIEDPFRNIYVIYPNLNYV